MHKSVLRWRILKDRLKIFQNMAASAKDPPLKLTSMLIGISLIKIWYFIRFFFLNELRVKFLSSLKKKSVKNSE